MELNPLNSKDAMYGMPQLWSIILDEITEEEDHMEEGEMEELIENPEEMMDGEEIQMAFQEEQEEFKEGKRLPSFLENNDTVIEHAPIDKTVEQMSMIMPLQHKDTFDDKDDLFLMSNLQYDQGHKRSNSVLRKSLKRKTYARQPSTSFKLKMKHSEGEHSSLGGGDEDLFDNLQPF